MYTVHHKHRRYFCKSKNCIIFNIHYCPELKKSKFDMTLIGHSPFKQRKVLLVYKKK